MSHYMLFTERRYYEKLSQVRKVLHQAIRHLTLPRPLWPIWRAYRRTWKEESHGR